MPFKEMFVSESNKMSPFAEYWQLYILVYVFYMPLKNGVLMSF